MTPIKDFTEWGRSLGSSGDDEKIEQSETKNPFDDPEVRWRMAQLIAQARRHVRCQASD